MLYFFQNHVFLPFGKTGIRPDLLLCFVIYTGVIFTFCRGGIICFVTGYVLEVLSGANSGLYIIIYLNIFITIKLLKRYFNFDTVPELLFLMCVCVVVKFLVILFCFSFIYESSYFVVRQIYIPETLYTVILFPVVFSILCKLYKDPRKIPQPYAILSNVRRI